MNSTVARALLEDAWLQVLDNKVFRFLAVLVVVPILSTFLIRFGEEEISILWGLYSLEYAEVLSWMSLRMSADVDAQGIAVQSYQSLVVGTLGGMFGVVFCVAATAFFVPRMLEKGAADTLFSKPVARIVLLLSRYFAGLLFVGVLAVLLVLGMYAGFSLRSGYTDPGFLWGAVTLIYLYALLHAFSLAAATFTRSSTAAILLTIGLFMLCGCVHGAWMTIDFVEQRKVSALVDTAEEEPLDETGARQQVEAERSGTVATLLFVLDALHYALPKTTDADILTEKLKAAVARNPYVLEDPEGGLKLRDEPAEFVFEEDRREAIAGAGWRWTPSAPEEAESGAIAVRRTARRQEGAPRRSALRAAKELEAELQARDDLPEPPTREDRQVADRPAQRVTWTDPPDAGGRWQTRLYLNSGDWLYEMEVELDPAVWPEQRRERLLRRFAWQWAFREEDMRAMGEMLRERYDWDAPLRYNLLFSVASSVAFALAMVGLAGWRLSRIDF